MNQCAWIQEKASATLHPAQVETTLHRIRERWPADAPPLFEIIEHFPLGESSLLHLLAVSSICAARLARDPAMLRWLDHPGVCASRRGYGRMLADLRGPAGGAIAAENFRALRSWKGRELLRIALREIAGVATLEETTVELSQVAEICVDQVFEHWNAEMRSRRGSPAAEFAILGLGKLGGRELNHSSDIDLIFLYSEEGQLSPSFTYHEWFNRLGAKILETFATTDAAGSLFRIDLRLRPEGAAGPLARSLESMENYYAGFGETWERLALMKARVICGSRELAYEFLRHHQPFIYPNSPTPDLLDEVARIKRRIEREMVGHENLARDVKLGAGGIREIEFIVQALQLVHGARHAFLQEPSTLKALRALAQLDLLPAEEARALDHAYRFLRWIEHRLQIEAEQQTHTVPPAGQALEQLALSLGFSSSLDFSSTLRKHMQRVRSIFRRVISEGAQDEELAAPTVGIFRDETGAAKAMAALAQGRTSFHVAPRTRQIFRKLRPLLLERLTGAANPDWTLTQIVRFVEAYGLRSLLFELLVVNPRLLELLVKMLDASRYASHLLVRRPQLLEEITRDESPDRAFTLADHLAPLELLAAGSLDEVRAYRHTQTLRILLRDVLGLASLSSLCTEHSALAEACLIAVSRRLGDDDDLTVVAFGKFGGSEISYGADLDVVFLGENTRAAQKLTVEMARSSAEGSIFTLDARLRPDGEKGPLARSLASCESYYETRAQLWELQALTRARPVLGPQGDEFLALAQRLWGRAGQRADLFPQINSMLDRIRRDRGSGSDLRDLKTGAGGMIEAEFLIQALQMRAGLWNPQTAGALRQLAGEGLITAPDAAELAASYEFLRLCESVLRRWENQSVASLPDDEIGKQELAVRAGFGNLDAFLEKYREAREKIHAIYQRFL